MSSALPSVAFPADPVKEVDDSLLLDPKATREVVKGARLSVAGRDLLDGDDGSEAGFAGTRGTFPFGASATI